MSYCEMGGDAAAEELRASELRYRRLFESARDGILILDAETGMVVDVNPFLVELLGVSRETFLSKRVWELGFLEDIAANEEKFAELRAREFVRYENLPLESASGRPIAVEFVSNVYLVNGHRVIQCNIRDITERRQIEEYSEMGRRILQILNEPGDLKQSIRRVIAELKSRTGFDAVGIRLQDGNDFPYFFQQGFPNDFLLTENTLTHRTAEGGLCRDSDGNVSLECTCGLVISGIAELTNPLFTPGGSCWTNDSITLLDIPPDEDPRLNPRNQCIHQGYLSVALVPIRIDKGIVGLIQLNDRRKGCFTLHAVELLEGIASHLGTALMRKRAENALQEATAGLERKVQERTAELVKRAGQLRAMAGALTRSEQRERRRIAAVLHDNLQQILVAAKFRAAALGRNPEPTVKRAALEIEHLLHEAVSVSRSVTAELSPLILHEGGMTEALQWLARWMADTHGQNVELSIGEGLPLLPEDVKILLFESVRELLFNAVKHANEELVKVTILQIEGRELRISVSDSGPGFDPLQLKKAGEIGCGIGLFGIRERLDLMGGRMEIDSAPGNGSRFMLTVPLCQNAHKAEVPAVGSSNHAHTISMRPPNESAELQG